MTRSTLATRGERARAAAAAIGVNLFLGIALITGLALREERRDSDSLVTFDVARQPPPEPESEQPKPDDPAPEPEGAEGRRAEASPVVSTPSPIPRPTPVAAAPVPAIGAAASSGNADRGAGTGAGGAGSGGGGGGSSGAGAGQRTPAALVSGGLGRKDARNFRALGMPSGRADFALLINPQGRVEGCQTLRSSGVAQVDHTICGIILQRFRFTPAREGDGRPIYYRITYAAIWGRG